MLLNGLFNFIQLSGVSGNYHFTCNYEVVNGTPHLTFSFRFVVIMGKKKKVKDFPKVKLKVGKKLKKTTQTDTTIKAAKVIVFELFFTNIYKNKR